MVSIASRRSRSTKREEANLHEGWVDHYSFSTRVWHCYFMTLEKSDLFLFYVDRMGQKVLAKMISLGSSATIRDLAGFYTFELTTETEVAGIQRNIFQFKNENDRDLWKGFIVAASTGVVPNDVKLLPGQLLSIQQTVRESQPPPLPHRPPLPSFESPYADIDELDMNTAQTETVLKVSPGDEVMADTDPTDSDAFVAPSENAVGQLMRRKSDLNSKILESISPPGRSVRMRSSQSLADTAVLAASGPRQNVSMGGCHSSSDRLDQFIHRHLNNNEVHPFYVEPERNLVPPSWFLECSRSDAEAVLTKAHRCGNVLMRPSTSSRVTGRYVISMRSDTGGGCRLSHYAVIRGTHGFRIDVDNTQQPMYCLNDVMKFFVSTVGPTARPLRSAVSTTRLMSGDVWSSFAVEPDNAASRHSRTQRAVTRSHSLAASVHACATDVLTLAADSVDMTLAADSVDTVTDGADKVAQLTLDDEDDNCLPVSTDATAAHISTDATTHVSTDELQLLNVSTPTSPVAAAVVSSQTGRQRVILNAPSSPTSTQTQTHSELPYW